MGNSNVSKPHRTTPPVRVSFPTLFTPRAFQPGQDAKFSIVLMLDKTDQSHMAFIKELHKDMQQALAEKWPDQATRPRNPLVGHTRSPIKDGDKTLNNQGVLLSEKNPEYAGHYIVRANTTNRPLVVNRNLQDVMDSAELYGGCFCKVNINVYTYNSSANKGVTCGLNGVQKWADGESFGGGRPPINEMFEADAGADDPANYGASPDPFGAGQDSYDGGPDLYGGGGHDPLEDDDIPF